MNPQFRLLFCSLIMVLVFPTLATAQGKNLLGIFTDENAGKNTIEVEPYTIFTVYTVIINPVNPEFGGETRPVLSPDMGNYSMRGSNGLEYRGIVNINPPTDSTYLVRAEKFAALDSAPKFLWLIPSYPATDIVYDDPEDSDGDPSVTCVPQSGNWDLPCFFINTDNVAVVGRQFGSVKALFR